MIPPKGYMTENDQGHATLTTSLEVYLDVPELRPTGLDMNLHSLPLTMNLTVLVTFLVDGRMEVQLTNIDPVNIDVVSGFGFVRVDLTIATGELSLNLVSRLIK
jgi:hypothetical protein